MLSELVRSHTEKLIGAMARLLARARISPNALTIMGFLGALGIACLIAMGRHRLGAVLILLVGILDVLDGAVARVRGMVTLFGGFLDSTLDRFAEAALYLGLLYFYIDQQPTSRQVIFLIFLSIIGSLMVSYARARAEGLGLECKVGAFTRFERIIVLTVGFFLQQVVLALWILAIFTNLTALRRIFHVWSLTREGQP